MQTIKNEQLIRSFAPAAFATAPEESRVSDRYKFLPTTSIMEVLQEEGWTAHEAQQVKSRTWSKDHAKHLIRFRHESLSMNDFGVGDSFPEMLLINCHNGLGSYQLRAGIYRMVCSNGMIVAEQETGMQQRHIGFDAEDVIASSRKIIEDAECLSTVVQEWETIQLSSEQNKDYVSSAASIRFGENVDNNILSSIGRARRNGDQGSSLWKTFNRVQEGLMRGGFVNGTTNRNARPITNINTNIQINTELWKMTQEFVEAIKN
jgi:hypothetical protein